MDIRLQPVIETMRGRLKIAGDLSNALVGEMAAWHNLPPFSAETLVDAEGMGWETILRVSTPPDVNRWSLEMGGIFHHLRSVLNNTLYGVLDACGVTTFPSLQYPITADEEAWRKEVKGGHLKGVPTWFIPALGCMQGAFFKNPETEGLLRISQFNNQDKHHAVLAGALVGRSVDSKISLRFEDGSEGPAPRRIAYDYSFIDGSKLIREDTRPHKIDGLKVEFSARAEVSWRDGKGVDVFAMELLEQCSRAAALACLSMIALADRHLAS